MNEYMKFNDNPGFVGTDHQQYSNTVSNYLHW